METTRGTRLPTTKTSLYEDVKNMRALLRAAESAIYESDWEHYEDITTRLESLVSASRWAARDNNGGAE